MANATVTYEDVERAAQGIKTTREKANPMQQFCGRGGGGGWAGGD